MQRFITSLTLLVLFVSLAGAADHCTNGGCLYLPLIAVNGPAQAPEPTAIASPTTTTPADPTATDPAVEPSPSTDPTAETTPATTASPTLTASATASNTPTATASQSASNTPTTTASPTSSATASATASPTASPTSSATPTATRTSTPGSGVTISWTTAQTMPIGRLEASSIMVGGKLYIFGGYSGNYIPSFKAHVFDPATGWNSLADTPRGLAQAGIDSDGVNIYLVGGYSVKYDANNNPDGQIFAITNAWRYSVAGNSYEPLPSLPEARGAGSLAYLEGRLHYFGGATLGRTGSPKHWYLTLDDLAAGWQSAAPLPAARDHMGSAVLNGKIYAVGGQNAYNNPSDPEKSLSAVHAWDPAHPEAWNAASSAAWTEAAGLFTRIGGTVYGRSHITSSTVVWNGKLLVMGGEYSSRPSGEEIAHVTIYDPLTNSWTEVNKLPKACDSGAGAVIDGVLYYAGGNGACGSFGKTVYKGTITVN